jgi:methylated-DNA-[protein]-cysteine S-methyltransferase
VSGHDRDCIVEAVTVTRNVYRVDGWGTGELWVDGALVVAHELPGPTRASTSDHDDATGPERSPPPGGARPPLDTLRSASSQGGDDIVTDLCRRVRRHLAGGPTTYDDLVVDDSWCTPFQAAMLEALRAVPWGEVVSYGELAALAGHPRAARAAGAFCAHNRFALIVPCHRVVSATSIGGYGSTGVETKRRLLRLEGVGL